MREEAAFKKLTVWQKSVALAVEIYATTKRFPSHEQFGLTSQMRRAALSIASNIAEGTGRGTKRDFAQFLSIALGSASELETQLEIARRIGYVQDAAAQTLGVQVTEVKMMLAALRRTLLR